MKPEARNEIREIIGAETDAARDSIARKLDAVFSRHADQETLRTGEAIEDGINVLEEVLENFLTDIVDRVLRISTQTEGYAQITLVFERLIWEQNNNVDLILRKTWDLRISGRGRIEIQSKLFWSSARRRLKRQLGLYEHSFDEIDSEVEAASNTPETQRDRKNVGGKPLAEHWDQMWAAIAVKLWLGDLQPKKQADVKVAMFDWFNQAGLEIGDTAVTQRARQLWQAMQEADG